MLETETAGDPMSEQKWQRSSLRYLGDELSKLGYWLSHTKIVRLLKEQKYSLKANVKRLSGSHHPDRDLQFQYIASQRALFQRAGLPIISVDTNKKELIGNFKTQVKNGVRKRLPSTTMILSTTRWVRPFHMVFMI